MKIPKDFTLGVATAAYQIEGTQFGTCGRSHWDSFAAAGGTLNGDNGDTACAHYNLWKQDLDLISQGGFDAYRFSIAWPRIFLDGRGTPNIEGLDFYDRLIDGLLERNIAPHITLYHWDLPVALANKGGWENQDTARWFADYAYTVTEKLGQRVQSVATINEPWCVAWLSHFLGHHAPGKTDISSAGKAMHNILYAHGLATQAMRNHGQKNLGIVLNMEYSQPASDHEKDIHAARLYDGIYNRWFIQAITQGSYPKDLLEHLEPHLPIGWQDQMRDIQQPLDWLGLNYYTRTLHIDDGTGVFPFNKAVKGPLPKTSMGWEIYPDGLGFFLNRLHKNYTGDIPLFVTENGIAGHEIFESGHISDDQRVNYIRDHIRATLTARTNGVPVNGYFAWSLLDNFEWAYGYSERFGIVHVDYSSQIRTPKKSFQFLQQLATSR